MSRQSARITVVVLAAIVLAGCGSGTKQTGTEQSDPYSGFGRHQAAMQRWCHDYTTLLNASGWTDNQIYSQLKDTGALSDLNLNTFKAQIRWCYSQEGL